MNASVDSRGELDQRIEAVETGYEFMLAYAAQGRDSDKGAAAGRNIREFLQKMETALEGLGAVVVACAKRADPGLANSCAAFFAAVDTDAKTAQAAIRLVLARSDISSQLVDNLNASIHLRALLTDLFVVDEGLKDARKS
jgi:alkylation response protein AidB-like acyl-CoA dehydrogenase